MQELRQELNVAARQVGGAAKRLAKVCLSGQQWVSLKRWAGRGPRVIGLEQLDQLIREADEAFARGEAEGRALLGAVELELDRPSADPLSPEFAQAQRRLYSLISNRERYVVDHEHSRLDVERALAHPYPYVTGSPSVVGEFLSLLGFVLSSFVAPRGGRVVEFGPGWGHTTKALAQTGFEVTAVEIDPGFVQLLKATCDARIVQSDMLAFESSTPFDAALFFESFHHCIDPLAMLRKVCSLLVPGGVAHFAAEPIDAFSYPWGVRTDGMSVYSMRKHGWLELGFEEQFFRRALAEAGFGKITRCSSPHGSVWRAMRPR